MRRRILYECDNLFDELVDINLLDVLAESLPTPSHSSEAETFRGTKLQ